MNNILKIFNSHLSPLQDLMFSGKIILYFCIYLIYLLIIFLIYKLYFKENIKLNLSKILGNTLNTKIEFYLNKIITLNKKSSLIWIWFCVIIITFAIISDTITLYNIFKNLNLFINEHISYNPNFNKIDISVWNTNFTIIDLLENIRLINYIFLVFIFSLILMLILKFNLNITIKNIFIWLIVLILITCLALNAVTYGELYTNINSYVTLYINLINK